jgi:hypothetical protein
MRGLASRTRMDILAPSYPEPEKLTCAAHYFPIQAAIWRVLCQMQSKIFGLNGY